MDQEIARLKELTEKSRAMVFFGGGGYQRKAASPTFEAWTGCIIKPTVIRRRLF